MSSPVEFVYLAADSPLVSMHGRPLKFIAAPFMGERPARSKGAGASFGTFGLRDGPKTGWLFIPTLSALNLSELQKANPGLDEAASSSLELEKLCWEYAETRRLHERNKEAVRLANLPQPTGPPQVQPPQPPVAMQPGDVYQGEWCAPARPPPPL